MKNKGKLLSIVIPAHNEEGMIAATIKVFHTELLPESCTKCTSPA